MVVLDQKDLYLPAGRSKFVVLSDALDAMSRVAVVFNEGANLIE